MTRKTICTATIFVAMIAAVLALLIVQVPIKVWWFPPTASSFVVAPVVFWILLNVTVPVIALQVAIWIIQGLWAVASYMCQKLRVRFQ